MADSEYKIIPATTADLDEITGFLATAQVNNRHLDWQKTITWLGSQPFLKCYYNNELISTLVCPVTRQDFVWIRAVNGNTLFSAERSWTELFNNLVSILKDAGINKLYSIPLSSWYERLLRKSGLQTNTKIVTLVNRNLETISFVPPLNIQIRELVAGDIKQICYVDKAAFAPLWQISEEDIIQAIAVSQNKSVVLDSSSNIIGYQISSNIFDTGHIARIAVLPEYHRKNIASALLQNLLSRFSSIGISNVTVNTSSDNFPATNLYLHHNFTYTQNNYPIYFCDIINH